MWAAGNSNAWYWKNVWVMGLVAVAAVSLAFGPAVAHKGGTTGYATVSVAGQTVRYALSLPANGSISGDAARRSRSRRRRLLRCSGRDKAAVGWACKH